MERIKKFEPLFGEWYAEALIREDENERVYRVFREKDGAREYCAVKHIPVPNDESIVQELREGGMDDETLGAYSESRLRDACREIAMMERLAPYAQVESVLESVVLPREGGLGSDVFIRAELMEQLSKALETKPLDQEAAARLAGDISAALAAFEKEGVVHRCVRPESVFVKQDGSFCLGELGSARVAGAHEEPAEDEPLEFAAPEVVKGEPKTARSDIYSLGLMLYTLTNGMKMPFEPENATPVQREKAAFRRLAGAKLPAPENAGALEPIIMKATACDPAERFASAAELCEAAAGILPAKAPEAPAAAETPTAAEIPVIAELPEIPETPDIPDIPDISDTPAVPAEPVPTAPKEPVTPVIGTAAMPVTGGEPVDRKAAKKAEKERRREEKRLKKQGAALPPNEEYEAEMEEEYEEYELIPRDEKRLERERRREEKRMRKLGMIPDEDYGDEDDELEEEPQRGRGLKIGIIIAAIIAGLALLGILGMLGKNFFDEWNARREETAFKPHAPEIVRDATDPDIYRITIYAKNGTPVVYENTKGMRREYSVNSDNRIVFELRGSDLIPDEPLESTAYSVQPKFYTRGEDQELTPVADMGFIMLEIPPVVVTMDCGDRIETEDGHVAIVGHVETIGAELFIDGERVQLTPDGNFKLERDYEENGENTIAFEAKMNRYATYKNAVTVSVNIPEPPAIQLPWDMGDTRFAQRVTDPNDTINVHGLAPAGSTCQISCENELVLLTEPEIGEDGAFSFSATLPEIGDYVIDISCTGPDGVVSTRQIHLQRAPEWKPYVESAWAMSYDALTRPSKQCYNVKGTVRNIIESRDYYLVELETSDGGTLLLEYHHHYASANSFVVGKTYNWIYGYPLGRNDEGAPVVYVWFVNDK